MHTVNMIVHNACQLVTCAGTNTPKRGVALGDVGIIKNGALAIEDGIIAAVGTTDDILSNYRADKMFDAAQCVICPGFVDPHTHLIFAGNRINEFEMRLQGADYLDILKQGGGILHTMEATRAATEEDLIHGAIKRLDTMLKLGTTTVEIKTGYGLDTETELKMLRVMERLELNHPIDIVPTFLAAHAVPPEFNGQPEEYMDLVIDEMLPGAAEWYTGSIFKKRDVPFFVDIFCEDGAFRVDDLRRLAKAGQALGMKLKAHVDEFVNLGGVKASLEHNAISVDHLDHTSSEEISLLGGSATIAVIIPGVNFHLGSFHFADVRQMIESGTAVALTTDANPGSAPCYSMPMVMAIASRYQKLLPAETLNACTINAAWAIGLQDRVGSLEIGKQADFLLVNTADYRHLAYTFGDNLVTGVVKKGEFIL